ncbi:MAG TPA: Nif3-like dinuclear metal center hexameric protein [Desulfotomaculum sp.]|nr:MAG: NGG1p interacting factor 3 protein, NIF3 [Peptococcaceae bacterium BRH_c8a]KJS78766.1 MAG: NGG1p interacting factor 3 protein, NIF3 [Desulfotomaculum sp. BICA1-6]HBX24535.1 Nif3-like dinuclear metal center hexameric protein [Desulfotomaculum sp.]
MAVRAKDVVAVLEQLAPPRLAEEWDNSGWQVGDPGAEVDKVLLALDVTPEVAKEATKYSAQLIISHHPVLLKGIKSVRRDDPSSDLIYRLIGAGIGVYAAHTNLDSARDGVNEVLARSLGLRESEVLQPAKHEQFIKLVVFVPEEHAETLREALGRAGAGWIGKYSDCTFNTRGTGTFRPREGASPHIGTVGELERVDEVRIETMVRKSELGRVVGAMLQAHPYEEVAYDLYPLENNDAKLGLGRIGFLELPVTLAGLAVKVKNILQAQSVRYGGHPDALVKKIAVCGGSGGDLWPLARRRGADVLVTGDIRYHAARDMHAAGMHFVDAGHFATERVVLPELRDNLSLAMAAAGMPLEIMVSGVEQEPWFTVS